MKDGPPTHLFSSYFLKENQVEIKLRNRTEESRHKFG